MKNRLYEILEQHRQETQQSIYVILDGVKYPMLWSDLEEAVLHYDMLFRETLLQQHLEKVAPFFVALDLTHDVTQEQSRALLECYGEGGTLFLASEEDFSTVLEAMRELFYVYSSDGEKGYMRFYDPKIFRHYISQESKNITYALFSEATAYWCEDPDNPSVLHHYSKEHDFTYLKKKIELTPKEPQNDL